MPQELLDMSWFISLIEAINDDTIVPKMVLDIEHIVGLTEDRILVEESFTFLLVEIYSHMLKHDVKYEGDEDAPNSSVF